MTQDDISNDLITDCTVTEGQASEPGTDEVDTVNVQIRLSADIWAAAVASAGGAAALVAYIEAGRAG